MNNIDFTQVTIAIESANLTTLWRKLQRNWYCADVQFVIDDSDVPDRGWEIMQQIDTTLQAIAIMDSYDPDMRMLWNAARQVLTQFLEHGWALRIGDVNGCLCIRIFDIPSNFENDTTMCFIPREGFRQMRNIDAWHESVSMIPCNQ